MTTNAGERRVHLAVGYRTADDNTFVFLLAHPSRGEADKTWPTDFSPMK